MARFRTASHRRTGAIDERFCRPVGDGPLGVAAAAGGGRSAGAETCLLQFCAAARRRGLLLALGPAPGPLLSRPPASPCLAAGDFLPAFRLESVQPEGPDLAHAGRH